MLRYIFLICMTLFLSLFVLAPGCNPCKLIDLSGPKDYCPGQRIDVTATLESSEITQISYVVIQGEEMLDTPLFKCDRNDCVASFCSDPAVQGDMRITVTASDGENECSEELLIPFKENCTGLCNL